MSLEANFIDFWAPGPRGDPWVGRLISMILGSRPKGGPLGWEADLSDFELLAQGGTLGLGGRFE